MDGAVLCGWNEQKEMKDDIIVHVRGYGTGVGFS